MNQKTSQSKGSLDMHSPLRPLYGVGMVGVYLIAFALSFVVSGCGKSRGGSIQPGGGSVDGKSISFHAVSSGSSATKTVYGGPEKTVGNVEPIYWSSGDILTIACAQSRSSEGGTLTSADYELAPTSDASKAMIYPVNNGNGLWWGTANPHHFYSLYPSSKMLPSAYQSSVGLTPGGLVKAVIPSSQSPKDQSSKTESGITTTILNPDMRFAYMWSGVSAAAKSSSVSMTFYPLFTAFEFEVGSDDGVGDLTLESFTMSSSTCALSGDFQVQITQGGGGKDKKSYTSIPARTSSGNDVITYTFPSGVVINSIRKARLTLFTLPARKIGSTIEQKISDITIKFTFKVGSSSTSLNRTLLLKRNNESTPIVFDGTKKYRITGLSLPTLKEATFTVEVIDYDSVNSDLGFGNVTVDGMDSTDGNNLNFS